MQQTVLECTGLTVEYRGQRVLNGLSLSLESGGIYALVGRKGAGKTTFIRTIAGHLWQNEGQYSLFGQTGRRELERARRKVGFLIDEPVFIATMTARQNLKVVAKIKAAKRVDYDRLLTLAGVENLSRSIMNGYSIGMRLRYAVAAALVGDPELLVLDEPIRGVNGGGVRDFWRMMREVHEQWGSTILIVCEELRDVYGLADKFIFMREGKVVAVRTAGEIADCCTRRIVLRTSDDASAVHALKRVADEVELTGDGIVVLSQRLSADEISQSMKANGIEIRNIEQSGQDVSEYYNSLIGGGQNA